MRTLRVVLVTVGSVITLGAFIWALINPKHFLGPLGPGDLVFDLRAGPGGMAVAIVTLGALLLFAGLLLPKNGAPGSGAD